MKKRSLVSTLSVVLMSVFFSGKIYAAECVVGYVTHFENEVNYRLAFEDLKTLLAGKSIRLLSIDTKDSVSPEIILRIDTSIDLIKYRKWKNYAKKNLTLTLLSSSNEILSQMPTATIIEKTIKYKPKTGEQIQQEYQMQSGEPTPLGYYLNEMKIHLGLKRYEKDVETVSLDKTAITEFAETVASECAKTNI